MPDARQFGPVAIRLALGVVFFAHGAQKVFGWWGGAGFSGTVAAFSAMGLPAPVTVLVMAAELLGGIGVFLGALTRLAALGIAGVMVGAILLVHLPHGFFMNWELAPGRGHGIETNLALLAMAVSLILTGAGPLSIDALRGRRVDLDRDRI
jgi:putative oxidoreductase